MQEEIKVPSLSSEELASGEAIFTHTLSKLGDKQSIVAQEDIYSDQGIKLISSGTKIKDKIWEKVVNHKLLKPITESVSIDNCVTVDEIINNAKSLIQTEPFFVRLALSISDPKYLLNVLKEIILPKEIAKKFTIVREARPILFQHSIKSAIVAAYFSYCHSLEPSKREQLLSAALLHDIGEMHIDPAILDPQHIVTARELHFIHVHPVTGYYMLQNLTELKQDAAIAILHHHERLDGSGYPSYLKTNQISLLGQIVAVAEVTAALTNKFQKLQDIKIAFNLNRKRFATTFIDYLQQILRNDEEGERNEIVLREEDIKEGLNRLSSVYNCTVKVSIHSEGKEPLNALNNRLKTLRYSLAEFGFDPTSPQALFEQNKDEPASVEAIALMVREFFWQNREILLFIDYNNAHIEDNLDKEGKRALSELKKELENTSK